jgi:hypothetical protein
MNLKSNLKIVSVNKKKKDSQSLAFSFYITHSIMRVCSWALVAHACNLSYLEGRNQEDHSSRQAGAKKVPKTPYQKKKAIVVVHICHPS